MRIGIGVVTAMVIGIALLLSHSRSVQSRQSLAHRSEPMWFKVVFGRDDQEAVWDGRLRVTAGELLDLAPWSFEARDQLDRSAATWVIQSGLLGERRATYAEPTRGVLVKLQTTPETKVAVSTKQGDFEFRPASIRTGRATRVLNGRASVEVMGEQSLVSESKSDDDFPAIAIDSKGHRHVAWIAFDSDNQRDQLLVRDVDEPTSKPQAIFDAEEFSSPHLCVVSDQQGRQWLRAVWCSPGPHQNWDVYSAQQSERGWVPERLSTAEGSDLMATASRGADGSLWVAWQSLREGNADIYVRRWMNGRWSDEVAVTSTTADEWEPSITVATDGSAWVGYDTYAHGNYDVYLNRVAVDAGRLTVGKPVAVTTSQDFEAHASVLAIGDEVWVAYDAAGPNWGKDFRDGPTVNNEQYSEPLHASRRVELRVIRNGQVHRPATPLPQVLPPNPLTAIKRTADAKPSRFYEFPQLARDGDDRVWLFFRMCRQGYCPHPPMGIDWRINATTYTSNGWLEPIELPLSQGRQNQRLAAVAGTSGRLELAWAEGNRFASVDRKYSVHQGRLPVVNEPVGRLPLELERLAEPGVAEKPRDITLTLQKEGREYRVLFGDLHRHTNISRCMPTVDGCLTDAHRYALNAVEYDFLAITDHTRDVDAFSWWRTQKAAAWFHVAGRYIPLYAYERSNGAATGGHRNVFFIHRGAAINPGDDWADGVGRTRPETAPDTTLYPFLRNRGDGLTIAHTPAYAPAAMKGTWTYNDPQVEPVTEIFQALRRSYERPDQGLVEQASVWYALKQGHRLGFIASSDHMSTHMSFACVWAAEKTREGIFEALQARRTYAATDRIGLAMQIGQALMGEETAVVGPTVTLRIRAECTAPIKELQVVRSSAVVDSLKPDGERLDFEWTDREPLDGTSHYYVRLLQENGALAWGSPIWVKR